VAVLWETTEHFVPEPISRRRHTGYQPGASHRTRPDGAERMVLSKTGDRSRQRLRGRRRSGVGAVVRHARRRGDAIMGVFWPALGVP